jgi:hypothetical protein
MYRRNPAQTQYSGAAECQECIYLVFASIRLTFCFGLLPPNSRAQKVGFVGVGAAALAAAGTGLALALDVAIGLALMIALLRFLAGAFDVGLFFAGDFFPEVAFFAGGDFFELFRSF